MERRDLLIKFLRENNIEMSFIGNELISFIHVTDISEFCSILDNTIFDDGGIECYLNYNYITIPDFISILNYYGLFLDDDEFSSKFLSAISIDDNCLTSLLEYIKTMKEENCKI